jgi:hypothetical protein
MSAAFDKSVQRKGPWNYEDAREAFKRWQSIAYLNIDMSRAVARKGITCRQRAMHRHFLGIVLEPKGRVNGLVNGFAAA